MWGFQVRLDNIERPSRVKDDEISSLWPFMKAGRNLADVYVICDDNLHCLFLVELNKVAVTPLIYIFQVIFFFISPLKNSIKKRHKFTEFCATQSKKGHRVI